MRSFDFFLYGNFDAELAAQNPGDPRRIPGPRADAVLSAVAEEAPGKCVCSDQRESFGADVVNMLVSAGVLRPEGPALFFDCPVFLREDAMKLRSAAGEAGSYLAGLLQGRYADIRSLCAGIRNGFSPEENLYHVLCGTVFDGLFFEYLAGRGAVAVSRPHPSGLDYLTVIYEKCDELQALSCGLLCSYNRLAGDRCALESFGDADGDRLDFYRLFRLMERGEVPAKYRCAKETLCRIYGGADREALLSDTASFVLTGSCGSRVLELLELLGYAENGRICVPVYLPEHRERIFEIEKLVEDCLGEPMEKALAFIASSTDITAVRHGAGRLEIANELYHLLFGSINEELVSRGLVAAPVYVPGEGRYRRCIEIYY